MGLKDFLKVLQRRLIWIVLSVIIVAGIYLLFVLYEKEQYRTRARLSALYYQRLAYPTPYIPIPSPHPRQTIHGPSLANWQAELTSADFRRRVADYIYKKMHRKIEDINYTVSIQPKVNVLIIEAIADTPQKAIDIASAVVQIAVKKGEEEANRRTVLQLGEIKQQIENIKKDNNDFKTKMRVIETFVKKNFETEFVEDEFEWFRYQIEGARKRVVRLDDEINEHKTHLDALRKVSVTSIEDVGKIGFAFISSPTIEKLNMELQDMHSLYQEQLTLLKSTNPKIIRLKQKIINKAKQILMARKEFLEGEVRRKQAEKQQKLKFLSDKMDSYIDFQGRYKHYIELKNKLEYGQKRIRDLTSQHDYLKANPFAGWISIQETPTLATTNVLEKKSKKVWPFIILIAVVLSVAGAYILELLDTTIKSASDVRRFLNLPTIATFPRFKKEDLTLHKLPAEEIVAEAYDAFATITHNLCARQKTKTILITSTNPREGKSTIAADLAIALAKQQRKVLLVDSDTRAPYLHRIFGLPNDIGLVNIITHYAKVKPVIERIVFALEEEEEEEVEPRKEEKTPIKQIPSFPTLRFISAGVRPKTTQQIEVTQENLSSFLQEMKKHFDYVILDSPPVLKAGDALRLASATDGIVFVIYAHKTTNREAYWAKQLLLRVNQNILGAVINMAVIGVEAEYYYSYYYRYKYRYYKSK